MIAGLALLAAGTWAAATYLSRPKTAGDELARRLQAGAEPERFAIAYAAGGTRVKDCFLPNRRFVVFVDRPADVLVVTRSAADPSPLVVARRHRVLLHRSLFRSGAVPDPWLAVPADIAGPAGDALRRALGTDLAGYVLTKYLPATGLATALAALEAADTVRRAAEAGDDRFTLTIDASRFEELTATTAPSATTAGTPPTAPTTTSLPAPTLDIWLDDNDSVTRIDVRVDEQEGASGWTTEYTASTTANPTIPASDIVDLADLDPAQLSSPRSTSCRLPL